MLNFDQTRSDAVFCLKEDAELEALLELEGFGESSGGGFGLDFGQMESMETFDPNISKSFSKSQFSRQSISHTASSREILASLHLTISLVLSGGNHNMETYRPTLRVFSSSAHRFLMTFPRQSNTIFTLFMASVLAVVCCDRTFLASDL